MWKIRKRKKNLIVELNKLDDKIKNKTLFESIEYFYYSKKLSNAKDEKKNDNKGIKLIKTFIINMYYLYGKINDEKIIKEYKQ